MVTGAQEEFHFRCFRTFQGKQKIARSTRQPQFRIANTLARTAVNQSSLALQQLASSSNSAIFNKKATDFQNCPNPSVQQCLPSTGNQKDLICFRTCSKLASKSTISLRRGKNYFHSHKRGDAMQKCKNIGIPNLDYLRSVLPVVRRK